MAFISCTGPDKYLDDEVISHKKFLVRRIFFLPQTKQLIIWPQSKQNVSYYCIKLWGATYVFFFFFSFIQSDVPVISVVCAVKKDQRQSLSVQFNFQNCNKCVFLSFHTSFIKWGVFFKFYFFLFKGARACSRNKKMCKYGNLLIK